MAEKGTVKDTERYPLEKLQNEEQVADSVHVGTCTQMGWCRGKEVTKKEYAVAVEKFKNVAAGRRGNA